MADYTVYYAPTPNGKKITLALEEMGLDYEVHNINFSNNDQFSPEFLKISPNNKIPTLVDHSAPNGDLSVFESGAILEYLAEKTGKFLPPPSEVRKRTIVKQWLYWQMAGFGPMLGQLSFFHRFSKVDDPVAKERYLLEALRLFGVLDHQLAKSKYIAGDEYSIADIATYWWSLVPASIEEIADQFAKFEHIKRWQDELNKRDAVSKALAIPFDV